MNYQIFNKDCLEELPNIKSNSINLIAIDPPYEMGYNDNDWDKKELNWNALVAEFYRILKDDGNLVIFQGWSNVSRTKETVEKKFQLMNWIVWDRVKGRGSKRNLVSTREDILWFSKTNDYVYNKIYSNIPKKTGGMGIKNGQPNRALSNVWTDISPIVPWSKERVKHPTQKPLKLMERIVTVWSNEGDIVLDCFMGSGTTGEASLNLNRKFIGLELDIEYYKISEKRLTSYKNKPKPDTKFI
tara:strand:- start:121 stop:849 length:729 start_codon:yes stop_codon:yes gene_type:complete